MNDQTIIELSRGNVFKTREAAGNALIKLAITRMLCDTDNNP